MSLLEDEPAKTTSRSEAGQQGLLWNGEYRLWPLPPPGPLVVGCRWPDRGVPETLVQIDPAPLPSAAARSQSVWQMTA